MPIYRRLPRVFVSGEGCWLVDEDGNRYLDLVAGLATNQLGHCHPAMVQAITDQAARLIHVPNSHLHPWQVELAEKICQLTAMDRAVFTPCGTTAIEAAIKIARKAGLQRSPDYRIICLEGSFHGRTMGSLSATGQARYRDAFGPTLPGFEFVPANDEEALRAAVNERTAAVMLEPIQGEVGVVPLTSEYMRLARELCDVQGAFLICDEIQTGMGRTGEWLRAQGLGVQPDIVVLAKGLGSGVPIGACLARGKAADVFEFGDHGTTSGGNPLACAVSLAVIEALQEERVLENTMARGAQFRQALEACEHVTEIRGAGLMLGVGLQSPVGATIAARGLDNGLILNSPRADTIRLIPPLVISESEVSEALDRLLPLIADAHRTA